MLAMHGILPGHCLPTRENSCLDHFMLKLNKNNTDGFIAVISTSITDHLTILLTLSGIKNKSNSCLRTKTIVDLESAKESLESKNLHELLSFTDASLLSRKLIKILSEALVVHTKILTFSRSKCMIKPWMTEGILRCIRNRNHMQLSLKRDPKNEILKITYRRYRNYCNNLI